MPDQRKNKFIFGFLSKVFAGVVTATFLLVGSIFPVYASTAGTYGNDTYGTCAYSQGCPASTPATGGGSTTVTTPAGLKVTINLQNGQIIPRSGYDITITPVAGQTSVTLAKAEIYLDNELQFTGTPGTNGSITWHWDSATLSATQVKILVYDNTGATSTYQFTVQIEQPQSQTQSTSTPSPTITTSASKKINWLFIIGSTILEALLIWLFIVLIVAYRRRRRS